ncbi:MAG TPA: hypothetical protein DHV62_05050 [Elusimicrobia bacterium]|jgi:molybdopterin molybdotransferase|nr:hypothetical protein [Elusimicrobiota bacterium]
MTKLLSAEKALKIVLNNVHILNEEKVHLTEGLNRILAENIYASENLPPFFNSAMDGYAVKAKDTKSATSGRPAILKLVEDLPAGNLPTKKIKTGETIKIMTGAILPTGADAVVRVEDTKEVITSSYKKNGETRVKIYQSVSKDENIRQIGEDVKKGELVLKKGKLIRAQEIALLAALGREWVKVYRQPLVAILTTGDELVEIKEKLNPGKIRDSNSYMLFAETLNAGGIPLRYGIIPDKEDILENKLREAIRSADLLLTSAGVSVGEYDLVKKCLLKLGFRLRFHTLAIRPGKPLLFGLLKNKPVFGLPGNPVSAMVTFKMFVRPAILKMRGQNDYSLPRGEAIIEEKVVKKEGIKYYLRGKLGKVNSKFYVRTTGPQGSGIISSLTNADCLVVLPEGKTVLNKGEKVEILFL